MSHIVQSTVKYRSLDALAAAVTKLGGEFVYNKLSFGWWGTFVGDSAGIRGISVQEYSKCLHEIKIKGTQPVNGHGGPWSIGVVEARDGDGYELRYDYFGGAGNQLASAFAGGNMAEFHKGNAVGIADEYAAEMAMRQLVAEGFNVERADEYAEVDR